MARFRTACDGVPIQLGRMSYFNISSINLKYDYCFDDRR